MQGTTLKVRMSTGKVLSDSARVLPSALEELSLETTSSDPFAYILDYPDDCVLSVFRIEEVIMGKQRTKFYIISGPDSTKITHKNIADSQQIFTRPIMIHSM